MWKAYSAAYIRHNQASSRFIMAVSFLASTLLSLVSGVFYQFWMDQQQQAIAATGSAQVETTPAMAAYIVVFSCASLGLIMMIHHAFAATMTSRIHQLGILKSVGASPWQIRCALIQEILVLSAPAILLGNLLGIGLCWLFIKLVLVLTDSLRNYALTFSYSPAVFLGSVCFSLFTAYWSAWIPARKISRISPIEAIRRGDDPVIRRVRRYRLFSRVSGIYAELARKSLYARRKAMRVGTVSIFLAVFSVVALLNMLGISNLSTQKTYFDRFRDAWDFVITAQSTEHSGQLLRKLRQTQGVDACSAYRVADGVAVIPADCFSDEVLQLGLESLSSSAAPDASGGYSIGTNVYILDDVSFLDYCGSDPDVRIVAVNKIWDSLHSERTDRIYLPLFKTNTASIAVNGCTIALSAYASELPALREEYRQGALSLVMSESAYRESGLELPSGKICYNIRAEKGADHEDISNRLQKLLLDYPGCDLEGRLAKEEHETQMQNGLRLIILLFAGLMACIGLANVFSSTLGLLDQRKREFARYFSVGLTASGAAKILAWEAAIVALRPILLTVLINIPLTACLLKAGGICAEDFIAKRLPLAPALSFFAAILAFVALAYILGGRKICRADLSQTIRDDTQMM